ncbi:MAG: alpha/beta hydrolase fold domain-containing protein [Streptosporangiales bacterium]|nr:alpha/beta hydrolase fold domain-containing protein [Streptosporangiales bacterium]
MPLLPELVTMIDQINGARAHLPDADTPVAERRAFIHRGMDRRAGAVAQPAPPVARADHEAKVDGGTITVRSYTPDLPGPLPGHVYIHGGGWWLGKLDHRDTLCARLAASAGCVVVSVAHRLAPEHRFPVPLHDCYAALRWLDAHAGGLGVDAARLSIGGDSSGANLAAATALMARDRGGPALRAQALDIPVLDLTMSRPSVREFAEGYVLSRDDLARDIGRYCDPDQRRDPYASPLLADSLAGLPPALIMTAEYDVLRDEGEAYGERLEQAGVPAEVTRWAGHVHGSHEMTAVLESARAWQDRVAAFLRARHAP